MECEHQNIDTDEIDIEDLCPLCLEAEIERLKKALRDCMSYVDVDNLTMQTKRRNWQAVLDGKPWNSSNVDVEMP